MTELRRPPSAPLAHTPTDVLSRASTEELLLELRRRIIAPRDTRHIAWDDQDGPDPQGGWPKEGLAASAGASLIASDAEQANG